MSTITAISRKERAAIVLEDEIANGVYAANYNERRMAKLAIGSLSLLTVALAGALVVVSRRPAESHWVVIDELHNARAIQYSDLRYTPGDGEVRSQITAWANYRYTLTPDTIAQEYGRNFYFLSRSLASQSMADDTESHLYSRIRSNQLEPNTVAIRDVTLQSKTTETIGQTAIVRGTALMTFDKLYSARTTATPRVEHWIAAITYYMNPAQVNDQSRTNPQYGLINPLGLTITEVHENRLSTDQATTQDGSAGAR